MYLCVPIPPFHLHHHFADNEYNLDTGETYMAQLEATYREAGIVIPFTYNDAGNQDHFINGTVLQ